MSAATVIWPLARAYARHIDNPQSDSALRAQLDRRLAFFPPWARLYLAASAAYVRGLAPLLKLGRARLFENLSADEKEACLCALQRDGRVFMRPLFLGIKSLLLACCYGAPEFLETIGYRAARGKALV